MTEHPTEPAVNATYIGSYRTIKLLGEGAFGLVYQAYQPFLDRQVAVKTLHADLTADQRVEQQFMHEARTIARLRHPNIVTVYEFGTTVISDKSSTYMVMEYLPGETLQTILKHGAMPLGDVVTIVEQLAQALDYAHTREIIHRDLKPANVIFTEQNQPVIVDYGLAKLMALSGFSNESDPGTLVSTVIGTPAYMSPEQVAGEPVGPASDQYSLATLAYEMLTGRLPFIGNDSTALMRAKLRDVPQALTAVAPHLPAEANNVFLRALLRDPGARYPSVKAFASALSEALLPEREPARVVTITDPAQAAQLRIARQSVLGFMWGLVLVTFIVILFCTAQFLRGFLDAEAPFIWDAIIASAPIHLGWRDVIGIWPGSPAEKAGLQPGDLLKADLAYDRQTVEGDYTINGRPRSAYPINWLPQVGDVIERTVMRNGQPVTVSYPLDRSTYQLITLGVQLPPALMAFGCAIWLIRRWGAEPGVQLFAVVLLMGCFTLIASGVSNVILHIDTLALFIIMPLLLHFVLVFPQPLSFIEQRGWTLRWLYLPVLLALVEFAMGRHALNFIWINLVVYAVYVVAIVAALIFKWGRREVKRYPRLWLLIAMLITASLVSVVAVLLFAYSDYGTVKTFWGGNGLNLYAVAYGLITIGSTIAILFGTLGYHRVQRQLGPSLVNTDSQSGSSQIRTGKRTQHVARSTIS